MIVHLGHRDPALYAEKFRPVRQFRKSWNLMAALMARPLLWLC